MRVSGDEGGLWWGRQAERAERGVGGYRRGRAYSLFMGTKDEKDKQTEKEMEKVDGRQNHSDVRRGQVVVVTGERGRTDKQTMFWVKKCNWWFVLEGMMPLWTVPAVSCPCCLTPLPWLTLRASPLTGGCLAGLAQVRHLDQGHSLPPTPLAPVGIILLLIGAPGPETRG